MRCAERMRRSLGPNYQEPNAIQQTGGLWWCRALPPCARAHLYGSAFLAISPLLKRPGLVPFLLLSTCESGEAGLKNCPAGDARLKVKEDERGQPGRLQSSSFLQRSLFARGRGRHYQLLFILFSIFRIAARRLPLFSSLTEVQRVAAAISPPACSQINI